jgi:hypothetical protein
MIGGEKATEIVEDFRQIGIQHRAEVNADWRWIAKQDPE